MAGLGYRLPGTRIEEQTLPQSVNISSSQRIPCFIGVASDYIKIVHEPVVRSSTGLVDNLLYTSAGIHVITQVGSQRGLNDFVQGTHFNLVSNQIVWVSSGIVTIGATYFVTYSYDRPYDPIDITDVTKNDYRYKEFTNLEDVINDLGDDIPANPLVMIAKVALRYYNVPMIATVQVRTGSTSDYAAALELIKYRDIQTVIPLTTNSTVRTLVISHVTERSLPDNMRMRMAWFGAASGTPVGSESDPTSLRGIAVGIKNELCMFVNATRAKYYYNDPITKEELYTVVDGSFIAAALAAYRDSFVYPSTTLLNKTVAGIELFDEDYDDYYSEYQLTLAGGSSVFLVESLGGVMRVVDDLTTDNSTVERNNINVITAKHYIAKDVAIQMNRTFKGRLITDAGSYTNTVNAYLSSMFAAYKKASIIESLGTIKVNISPLRRDTIEIHYEYISVYTNKYIEGTYSLLV
jgi:hypothetical protein